MAISMQRSFRRRIDVLDELFAFVAEFLAAADVDRGAAFDLEFILEEMFTNMVKYNRGGGGVIGVELERLGDSVRIQLTDADVAPFDPSQLPAADTSSPLVERKVGGLGVHLVRRMAESLTYEHRDGTNIVTVVKRLED
jgi:serine/threonine-protein kinase RsbW